MQTAVGKNKYHANDQSQWNIHLGNSQQLQ